MTKHCFFSTAAALVCAGSIMAAQQQPTPAPQQRPEQPPVTTPADPTAAQGEQAVTTLVGCLYRERDVPGRQPNVAERAGILEDYILADASPQGPAGTVRQGEPETAEPRGTPGPAGQQIAGKMYKVEHADDEQLRDLVGKRVEVTGRIDAEAGDVRGGGVQATPQPDETPGPDQIELPEFEAQSIRAVAGNCPAVPNAPPPPAR